MERVKTEKMDMDNDTISMTYIICIDGKGYEIIFKASGDSLWRHTYNDQLIRLSVTIYPMTNDKRVVIRDGIGRDYYKGMTIVIWKRMLDARNIMERRNLMQYDFTAEQVGMLRKVSQFIDARMNILNELKIVLGGV